MTVELVMAFIALVVWISLILGREASGSDASMRTVIHHLTSGAGEAGENWPSVVAVVPARNEADMLPRSLASLLAQDYQGPLSIVIVDDQSNDGTAQVARRVAEGGRREVIVLRGRPLPAGWTGKVWALEQGIAHASTLADPPRLSAAHGRGHRLCAR